MRGMLISVLGAAALGLTTGPEPAQADEAYVCEGGRVVYVRFGELETMKRRDPCIAAYHSGRDGPGHGPASAEAALVVLTGAASASTASPPRGASSAIATGTVGRGASRTSAPPVAHPDTDFRNIRILNAAPGESQVYRHLR